jgi:hypothetical protein
MNHVLLFVLIVGAVIAVAVMSDVWGRVPFDGGSPKARFHPGDRMTVSAKGVSVDCTYWVEWGDNRWHVDIVTYKADEATGLVTKSRLRWMVAKALNAPESRFLIIDGVPASHDRSNDA